MILSVIVASSLSMISLPLMLARKDAITNVVRTFRACGGGRCVKFHWSVTQNGLLITNSHLDNCCTSSIAPRGSLLLLRPYKKPAFRPEVRIGPFQIPSRGQTTKLQFSTNLNWIWPWWAQSMKGLQATFQNSCEASLTSDWLILKRWRLQRTNSLPAYYRSVEETFNALPHHQSRLQRLTITKPRTTHHK